MPIKFARKPALVWAAIGAVAVVTAVGIGAYAAASSKDKSAKAEGTPDYFFSDAKSGEGSSCTGCAADHAKAAK